MSCPNACSGHGRCSTMREMAVMKNALPLSAPTSYTGKLVRSLVMLAAYLALTPIMYSSRRLGTSLASLDACVTPAGLSELVPVKSR